MPKRLRHAFVLLVVISMQGYLVADEPLSQNLDSRDSNMQVAAGSRALDRDQALKLRQTIVNECLKILQSRKGKFHLNDPRRTAIRVIEAFRAPEAVDPLIRIIEYPNPLGVISEDRGPTLVDGYPAARALVSIGKPASRACIYELTNPNSPLRREKLCAVIRYVEGAEIGRILLCDKMRELDSDAEKIILKKAIVLYEELFKEK